MKIWPAGNIRTRLTLWYVSVLAVLLILYIALVFAFQYSQLKQQLFHDEVQDVETVEGLLFFGADGGLRLQQNYYSHPRSHLLIDRLMEVRDLSGTVLYRSDTLSGMSLGGATLSGEGDGTFNERIVRLSDGTRVFLISHTHSMQGKTLLIRLGYSLSPFHQHMMDFFSMLLFALPGALLAAGFAGYGIAKRALRPLEQMAARAEQISASKLHSRLEIENDHDELGHMAKVFNQLLQRLEEAFEQLRRFTADAAHELRTPLASLRIIGEVALQKAGDPDDYREAIGSILEETGRLNQTIEDLLILAKAEVSNSEEKDSSFLLCELVDEVLIFLGVLIEERSVKVVEDKSGFERVPVRADRALVRMAIMNVLHNAVKFAPTASTLTVTCATRGSSEPFAEIVVQDEGPGLAPDEYQSVFERFFTSSASGTASNSGTGLGLSIAKFAIERSSGEIFFDATSSVGARCVIRIPLSLKF